jgi:putative zinc finger/helix-turn-helix YgiT family protein
MVCTKCGGQRWKKGNIRHQITVGAHRFAGDLAAQVCVKCGEALSDDAALQAFERAVATRLLDAGAMSGAALKFVRKAAGLKNTDAAELLGVRVETLSRWERDVSPVDRAAGVTLAQLLDDSARERTLQRLRAAAEPRKLAAVETIAV